ncbi:hypothetical protein AVEN_55309-1 [Araneus ventricosus]|uniref:Uncharacterized protein n=1 Tax=Araneus ventricosus TaxID=182803 RepID=A0A4Y2D8R6_ARAVE|nr:hypothetical protein AVEN_55309-1 [Araneus ventricosus]
MTRATPELATPSSTFRISQRRTFASLRMIQHTAGPMRDGSSVESGFGPGSGSLTTRPPRPFPNVQEKSHRAIITNANKTSSFPLYHPQIVFSYRCSHRSYSHL